VEADLRNETVGLKIREHAMQKIPYQLIVGAREQEQRTVAVRARHGDLGAMTPEQVASRLLEEARTRAMPTGQQGEPDRR